MKVGDLVRLSKAAMPGIVAERKFSTGIGVVIEVGDDLDGMAETTYNIEFRYRTERVSRNWYFGDELEKLDNWEKARVLAEHVFQLEIES